MMRILKELVMWKLTGAFNIVRERRGRGGRAKEKNVEALEQMEGAGLGRVRERRT